MEERSVPTSGLPMKRRQFLKLTAGATAAAALGSSLAACAPTAEQTAPEPLGITGTRPAQPDYDRVARTVCAPNCVGSCGINAYVKDDALVKIEPAEFPNNEYRRICLRGMSNAMQRVYADERVKYPMKRAGERGSGQFERISWNEALDLIYEQMQKNIDTYGPTANAFLGMTGNYGVFPQIMASLLAMTYDGTAFTNFGIMGDNGCNMGFCRPSACSRTPAAGKTCAAARPLSCSAATTPRRTCRRPTSCSTPKRPERSSSS